MYNSLKNKTLGGGGKVLPRDTINRRVKSYVEKKLNTDFDHIEPDDRMDIIYVLVNNYEYSVPELMQLFGRCRATIYREISNANFIQKRIAKRKKHSEKIHDYIIYNAKYIP